MNHKTGRLIAVVGVRWHMHHKLVEISACHECHTLSSELDEDSMFGNHVGRREDIQP